jgi:hypothetical protein
MTGNEVTVKKELLLGDFANQIMGTLCNSTGQRYSKPIRSRYYRASHKVPISAHTLCACWETKILVWMDRMHTCERLSLEDPQRQDPSSSIKSSSIMAGGDGMSCRLCRYQGSDIRLLGCGCTLHAVSFFVHIVVNRFRQTAKSCLLVSPCSSSLPRRRPEKDMEGQ